MSTTRSCGPPEHPNTDVTTPCDATVIYNATMLTDATMVFDVITDTT